MYIFILLLIYNFVECTVDLNLAELEYIANQLTPVECEKLSDYLHISSYEVTAKKKSFFSFGERSCLEILVHWNNSPNEGLDQTHSVLAHRLKQVGRKDLAEWLSSTVFNRLSIGLNKSILANPFNEIIMATSEVYDDNDDTTGNNSDLSFFLGEPDWETYDTIAIAVAILLFFAILLLICELCGCFKCCQKKQKKEKFSKNRRYSLLPQEEDSSTEDEKNAAKLQKG